MALAQQVADLVSQQIRLAVVGALQVLVYVLAHQIIPLHHVVDLADTLLSLRLQPLNHQLVIRLLLDLFVQVVVD